MKKTDKRNNPYTQHIPIIGKKLWKLALEWSQQGGLYVTVKEKDAAIKSVKGRKILIKTPGEKPSRSLLAARLAVLEASESIKTAREARIRARKRNPYAERIAAQHKGRAFRPANYLFPMVQPRNRLQALISRVCWIALGSR